jgi:uncharacterized protein YigE (DUF2233 family)
LLRSAAVAVLAAGAITLAISARSRGGDQRAAASAIAWEKLEPGVEHARAYAQEDAERGGRSVLFELYRFDLASFRPEVIVSKERPFARLGAGDVLRDTPGAVAVVNGGFFDEKGAPLGLRIARGKTVVPLRPRVDWGVLAIAGGRASIVHSRQFVPAPEIEAAIQVGPRIVVDGVVPRLKPQVARRTAVALPKDGTSMTLVVAPQAVDAAALGARLAELGYHAALMLDGGPSTQLAVSAGGARSIPGGYGVPDLLALVRRR